MTREEVIEIIQDKLQLSDDHILAYGQRNFSIEFTPRVRDYIYIVKGEEIIYIKHLRGMYSEFKKEFVVEGKDVMHFKDDSNGRELLEFFINNYKNFIEP